MATFKVGQRVKMVRSFNTRDEQFVGREGCITGPMVDFFGVGCWPTTIHSTPIFARCLEPLTDPRADAFLESIKRLKPYEEPTVNPDRVTKHNVPMATFHGSPIYLTERGAFILRDGEWIDLGKTRNN